MQIQSKRLSALRYPLSALLGGLVGRAYDGSTGPLMLGFVAFGVAAFVVVAITERGRLFVSDP